jgi:OOP family OmpA-OmpF porin
VKTRGFKFSSLVLATAALTLGASAQAQSTSSSGGLGGFQMYTPGTGYVGISAGRSYFDLGSGIGAFNTDDKGSAYSIYGGSFFNPNFGLELAYIDFGDISRGGGTSEAYGANLSLVGRIPVGQAFSLTGRLGSTYGRTEVSSVAASGITAGKESGFGFSYGIGAEYAFNQNLSAVVRYDEHDLKYIGSGRDSVGVASIGLKYRF